MSTTIDPAVLTLRRMVNAIHHMITHNLTGYQQDWSITDCDTTNGGRMTEMAIAVPPLHGYTDGKPYTGPDRVTILVHVRESAPDQPEPPAQSEPPGPVHGDTSHNLALRGTR